jgi:uncharacterized protein YdaU (DUF1376 family)
MTSPAFQFYVQDFLTGTMYMSSEEVGAYVRLLCHQWDKGALPASDRELMRIARTKMKTLEVVKGKFDLCDDGLLRNARLEKERGKQASWKLKSSEAGKKSGEARRTKSNQPSDLLQTKKQPDANSSSSTSFSSSTSERDIAVWEPKDFLKEKNAVALSDIERTLPPGEWERCLSQWNLAVLADPDWQRTGDDARDIQMLTARLRKWSSTWNYNLEKEKRKSDHVKPIPKNNLDRIGDAADQVLAAIGSKIGG